MSPRLLSDEVLSRVKSVPALPRAVHELGEALRRDNVPIDHIVRVVGTDQALTLAALRLANSPFYGFSGRVVTLSDAVQMLGLHTLSAAVMTAAVMSRFDRRQCVGFDLDAAWRHAIATAVCAQRLAQSRGLDGDEAYTAGLLHDVGRLALATCFPHQFDAMLAGAAERDIDPLEAERDMLGIDHAEVGAMLAQHWRLAPCIVDAIRLHHEPPSGRLRSMLDAVHLADNITHALDVSGQPDDRVPPLSLCAWERMAMSGEELQGHFKHVEDRMAQLARGLAA